MEEQGPIDTKILSKYVVDSNKKIKTIESEVGKVVIGQKQVLKDIIICLLSRGHIILEGAPGLAKTLLVKALASVIGGNFQRIQFTADLLPTDITGFQGYNPKEGFFISKGPVFANFVLADEINRSPPKVQSAMIEVMQELQVTIAKKTFFLQRPFIVLATENPIETRGTYPLPEAQLDRFLFKSLVYYPEIEDEKVIMSRNVSIFDFEDFDLRKVCSLDEILSMQNLVRHIFLHDKIKDYISRIIDATRNPSDYGVSLGKFIEWGGSPRASINCYIAAKANALLDGRTYVIPQDVKDVAHNILRHRLILTYDARVMNINSDAIIDEILDKIEVP